MSNASSNITPKPAPAPPPAKKPDPPAPKPSAPASTKSPSNLSPSPAAGPAKPEKPATPSPAPAGSPEIKPSPPPGPANISPGALEATRESNGRAQVLLNNSNPGSKDAPTTRQSPAKPTPQTPLKSATEASLVKTTRGNTAATVQEAETKPAENPEGKSAANPAKAADTQTAQDQNQDQARSDSAKTVADTAIASNSSQTIEAAKANLQAAQASVDPNSFAAGEIQAKIDELTVRSQALRPRVETFAAVQGAIAENNYQQIRGMADNSAQKAQTPQLGGKNPFKTALPTQAEDIPAEDRQKLRQMSEETTLQLRQDLREGRVSALLDGNGFARMDAAESVALMRVQQGLQEAGIPKNFNGKSPTNAQELNTLKQAGLVQEVPTAKDITREISVLQNEQQALNQRLSGMGRQPVSLPELQASVARLEQLDQQIAAVGQQQAKDLGGANTGNQPAFQKTPPSSKLKDGLSQPATNELIRVNDSLNLLKDNPSGLSLKDIPMSEALRTPLNVSDKLPEASLSQVSGLAHADSNLAIDRIALLPAEQRQGAVESLRAAMNVTALEQKTTTQAIGDNLNGSMMGRLAGTGRLSDAQNKMADTLSQASLKTLNLAGQAAANGSYRQSMQLLRQAQGNTLENKIQNASFRSFYQQSQMTGAQIISETVSGLAMAGLGGLSNVATGATRQETQQFARQGLGQLTQQELKAVAKEEASVLARQQFQTVAKGDFDQLARQQLGTLGKEQARQVAAEKVAQAANPPKMVPPGQYAFTDLDGLRVEVAADSTKYWTDAGAYVRTQVPLENPKGIPLKQFDAVSDSLHNMSKPTQELAFPTLRNVRLEPKSLENPSQLGGYFRPDREVTVYFEKAQNIDHTLRQQVGKHLHTSLMVQPGPMASALPAEVSTRAQRLYEQGVRSYLSKEIGMTDTQITSVFKPGSAGLDLNAVQPTLSATKLQSLSADREFIVKGMKTFLTQEVKMSPEEANRFLQTRNLADPSLGVRVADQIPSLEQALMMQNKMLVRDTTRYPVPNELSSAHETLLARLKESGWSSEFQQQFIKTGQAPVASPLSNKSPQELNQLANLLSSRTVLPETNVYAHGLDPKKFALNDLPMELQALRANDPKMVEVMQHFSPLRTLMEQEVFNNAALAETVDQQIQAQVRQQIQQLKP